MARKITTDAINAFMAGQKFHRDNTSVEIENEHGSLPSEMIVKLKLHGNLIAKRFLLSGSVYISNAGWQSNTTKERLNGIPGVHIVQRKGQWYLNDKEWDGSWTQV